MGVAPGVIRLGANQMFLTHIHAAGVADFTVNDGNFAVVAIVNRMEPPETQEIEVGVHLDAATTQAVEIATILPKQEMRAESVKEDAYFNPFLRFADQQVAKFLHIVVRLPNKV